LLRKCLFRESGLQPTTIIAFYFVSDPDDGIFGWTLSEVVGVLEVVDELHPAKTSRNRPTTTDKSFLII